jgi:hypothetical protein
MFTQLSNAFKLAVQFLGFAPQIQAQAAIILARTPAVQARIAAVQAAVAALLAGLIQGSGIAIMERPTQMSLRAASQQQTTVIATLIMANW